MPLPEFKYDPSGYFIYDNVTEKFSRGGTGPDWGRAPKIWSGLGPLKNHINQFVHRNYNRDNSKIIIRNEYSNSLIYNVLTRDVYEKTPLELMYEHIERQKKKSIYWHDVEIEVR